MASYKKLRTMMYANDDTQSDIAKALGRSPSYVAKRMTGETPFNLNDVYAIMRHYKLPPAEISEYFPEGGKTLPTKRRKS